MPNLPKRYKETLEVKNFLADPQQEKAVVSLQRLLKDLTKPKSFSLFKKKTPVRGIYLYGGVGRGKSMLMDLFFQELPLNAKNRRVHFHEFMIETHDWLHQNRGTEMDDLLPAYARHVAGKTRVLCFDEFHVTDVADAMILGRLFTHLFDYGVIVVSTSNWAPDNLYEGGLQRELFLPFIALLKTRMEIVYLDSDTDYREISDPDQNMYFFSPLNEITRKKIDRIFIELSKKNPPKQEKITVKGRVLNVLSADKTARFTFAELCEKPLGAEDYIQIAKRYHNIIVEGVPILKDDKRNEVKRLILLIDCLYEAHCRLVLSAASTIHDLYDGDEHGFEFDRTISRLMEMQSAAYQEKRGQG